MDNIHGDSPGLNTPVDDEKRRMHVSVRHVLLGHEQVLNRLNLLNDDVQILLAAANLIRVGVDQVHRAARNPVAHQTREEWLRAYDGAEVRQ